MDNQIVCPNCKKSIPLTQALSHQIQEKYQKFFKQRLEEEKLKIEQVVKEEQYKKVKAQMELEFKDKTNENEELKKQNKALQEQLLELNRLMRQIRQENQEKQLELEKKLAQEQDKIRIEEKKRSDDENRMKFLEYEKKIQDISKVKEDLERKLEQKSQQMQGEVLELELVKILEKEFPYDEIREVPKGVTGADVLQIVKNNYGKACGTIVWELKRTKAWTDTWITKLKEDQRQLKAEVAVIISQTLPDSVENLTQRNGVWIGNFESIVSLGLLLRNTLVELSLVKASVIGKQEKKEILWNYLTSIEFRQRFEAMYDSYQQSKMYLDKEKEFFRRKWAREEKNVERLMQGLMGIHGDLQGIIGKSLSEIKDADILPPGEDKKAETLFQD